MEREERSRRWPVPPQQALVDVGAQPRPAATLRGACAVLPHQMKTKSPIPSFLVARGGCPGQICPLGTGWSRGLPAHLVQGFRAIVCLDSIAALVPLSAGQSRTQDYETSSHEPLPRTPTCTTCKCQHLLSPVPSAPYGNGIPQSACGGTARRGKGNAGGEGQETEKQAHGEAERAAMQDGASSCWEAEGFGLLTSAPALMAALTSPASLAAWWLLRASRSAELGGGRPPAPAHSPRLPRSLVFNQRLLFRHKSWCMELPALLLIIDFLNWCLQRAWG